MIDAGGAYLMILRIGCGAPAMSIFMTGLLAAQEQSAAVRKYLWMRSEARSVTVAIDCDQSDT